MTTHWPKLDGEALADARNREEELKTDRLFMRQFLDKGARIERFEGGRVSALKVINVIPYKELSARVPLQVQTELILEERALQITQAGRHVAEGVLEMMSAYEQAQLEQRIIAEQLANVQDERSMALRKQALSDADIYAKLLEQIQTTLESVSPMVRITLTDVI